jgi:hypothetical protein
MFNQSIVKVDCDDHLGVPSEGWFL